MLKKAVLLLGFLVVMVLVIYIFDIPFMENPTPDYHSVQNRPGPNTYRSRVSIKEWIHRRTSI